jgi:hypothetical protein
MINLLSTFLILMKSFALDFESEKVLTTRVKDIKIYYEEALSPVIPYIYENLKSAIESAEEKFGKERINFKLVISFKEDEFSAERFFTPSPIIYINYGGTRIDKDPFSISLASKIKKSVFMSAVGDIPHSLPKYLRVIQGDFFLSPEIVSAFGEYGIIDQNFYQYPFFGSKLAQTIKFIELKYGQKEVNDIFLEGKIFPNSMKNYEKEFREWKRKRIEEIRKAKSAFGIKIANPENVFDFPSIGVVLFPPDEIITTKMNGEIFSSKKGVIFKRNGGYILNGRKNIIVFDSKDKDGFFKTFIIDEKGKIHKLEEKRAWYPDIYLSEDGKNGKIFFVKKNLTYDELCFVEFQRKEDDFSFGEKICPLKSEAAEEFLTPSVSEDGRFVAFSVIRRNGFCDIVVLDTFSNSVSGITQDEEPDLFPSWYEGKLIFSSFREGKFSIYSFDGKEFSKILEGEENILLGKIKDNEIYSVFQEDGEFFISKNKIETNEKADIKRRSLVLFSPSSPDSEKEGIKFERFGIHQPKIFFSSTGFLLGSFNLFLSDSIFTNPLYLQINIRTNIFRSPDSIPFGSEPPNIYFQDRGNFFGLSLYTFIRKFQPNLFFRVSYNPSGIFIRRVSENSNNEYEFVPENIFSSQLIFFYKIGKAFLLFGGEGGDISGKIPEIKSAFWDSVRDEYRKFGSGSFFNLEAGGVVRTARRTFALEDGADLKIFFGLSKFFNTPSISPFSEFSFSLFSPRFRFFVLSTNINGFFGPNLKTRAMETLGSKDIPYYFDPPYNLSPLLKFGLYQFLPEDLKYDIGVIRGVRVRKGQFFTVLNLYPVINILYKEAVNSVISINSLNVIPFSSFGILKDILGKYGSFISFGSEIEINSVLFFSIPTTFKFGFANGEVKEFYFLIFITPGTTR